MCTVAEERKNTNIGQLVLRKQAQAARTNKNAGVLSEKPKQLISTIT
jgi:hypothetical protein